MIAQFDPFARPFDSGEVQFELDDLHIDTLESQIDVPTLSITVNMGSFGRGKATWLALDYGHRGLNVAARGANTGLIPHKVTLRLRLDDLPLETFADAMRDELAEELELDQSALTAALLNQLFIALGEQQPSLSLDNWLP